MTETTVTATVNDPEASYVIKLGGVVDDDGVIPLRLGSNVITIAVTAEDGITTRIYTVRVTRGELPEQEQQEQQDQTQEKPTPTVELDGISASHDSVRENDGQATTITLAVTLDKAAAADEKVTLAIVSPTKGKMAKRGEDFDATMDETITIAKGRIKGTAQLTLTPKDNTAADGDKAFAVQATSSSGHRALINIEIADDEMDDGEMDDGEDEGEDEGEMDGEDDGEDDGMPAFAFAGEVEDQAYTAGAAITALVLPEATGGEGEVTYRVFDLPAGLTFDAATRTISGTPEAATDGAVEVTCFAQDSAGAAATLIFSITVNPSLSFGDLFGLLNGGANDAEAANS